MLEALLAPFSVPCLVSGAVLFACGAACGWLSARRMTIADVLRALGSVRENAESRQLSGHGAIGFGPTKATLERLRRLRGQG